MNDEFKNIYDNKVMEVVENIPTDANLIGTKLTVAITSEFNWDLKQLDIKDAYLNPDLEKKIYTKIPYCEKKFF